MSRDKGRSRNTRTAPVTWAQAVRDITISSMNKGQLPVLGVLGFLILALWRIPPPDVTMLLLQIIENLKNGMLGGYALSFLLILGWFFHAKKMRTEFSRECQRIGQEKSDLQGSLSGAEFNSSDST